MLIDWITARLPESFFSREEWDYLVSKSDRILRYNPATGEQVWESSAWESIRSDSHQLAFKVGSDSIRMQGSPARVIGDGCNVFSSGAANNLDLVACVSRMADYFFANFGLQPRGQASDWLVSRIDITGNLLLDSAADVRIALSTLKNTEIGRLRVTAKEGNTVYWGGKSRLRRAKAYAKGAHLEFLQRTNKLEKKYTDNELFLAGRLLRLELTMGAQLLRERMNKKWHELTALDLFYEWQSYFSQMIGNAEMTKDNILDRIMSVASTERQARNALATWSLIQSQGWELAKSITTKSSWYRNLKILRDAGLSDSDFSAGEVVPFRSRIFEAQIVHSWDELRRLAA
jgi:II/X family phage/plasmid replication protein